MFGLIKKVLSISVFTIYCLSIGSVQDVHASSSFASSSVKQNCFRENGLQNLVQFRSETEPLIVLIQNYISENVKTNSKLSFAQLKELDSTFVQNDLRQYVLLSKGFSNKYRILKLCYPFHSHW